MPDPSGTPSPRAVIGSAAMEGHEYYHDWEILVGPEIAGEDLKLLEASDDGSMDGGIKSDYFALDARTPHHEMEQQVDSDNPSWVDPESDSGFLDRPKGEVGFPGVEFPIKDLGEFWSDATSDEQRSHLGSEKGGLYDDGGLEFGERAEGDVVGEKEVGLEDTWEIEGRETGCEKPGEEGCGEQVKMTDDGNIGSENVAKPVWSISIVAAILGFLMLRKRFYRIRQKPTSIHLNLSLDEKKASQLKIHAARLNKAFTVVRRVPIIRASLPAAGVTQRSMVGLQ
ncbi:hypothetical protein C4D60_Mb05t01300 [Musa balbisiana]|uniref:Uncharacterized protein n=1 Tax=Musa balbisiana TaxID=52838 RepID=A0A4S8JSV5_MUSBA|nr:hypothetical protein C4D60_Mb05t01300 [Musa balbisiana]